MVLLQVTSSRISFLFNFLVGFVFGRLRVIDDRFSKLSALYEKKIESCMSFENYNTLNEF